VTVTSILVYFWFILFAGNIWLFAFFDIPLQANENKLVIYPLLFVIWRSAHFLLW